jgi:hypothetical protein
MKGREIIWCVSGRRGGGIYRCSWGLDFRKGKTEEDRREKVKSDELTMCHGPWEGTENTDWTVNKKLRTEGASRPTHISDTSLRPPPNF